MTALNIVPECYVDTRVAEIIGKISQLNHQHGHGNVANKMKVALRNRVALGIIDQDTVKVRKSDYFDEFELVTDQNYLRLYKHRSIKHYLIVICPEIEKWLMYNADEANLNPADFGLPEYLSGFIKMCKRNNIDRNQNFTLFIKNLLGKETPGIMTFKTWIDSFLSGQELL